MSESNYFSDGIIREFFNFINTKYLGEGIARRVYRHPQDPSLVIKIEGEGKNFQNILEWEFWKENKEYEKVSKWLAPCVDISPSGIILLQKYAKPLKSIPKEVPTFLTDHKLENFGLYKNKIVCVDYGFTINNPSIRMKKWNGEEEIYRS